MKTILILGAGEMQIPIIEKCNNLGLRTVVTDYSAKAPGLNLAAIPVVLDTLDMEGTLEIAKEYNVDGILTTSDQPVKTVAYVCEMLNLKGLNRAAAELSTDKFLQRYLLAQKGILIPKFLKVKEIYEVKDALTNWRFPVIVKPVDSSASRGVSQIDCIDELDKAFKEAKNASRSGEIIVEEFIVGNEYSVECLTQNGKTHVIGITEKFTVPNLNYFVEEKHIIPADLSNEHILELSDYTKKIIEIFDIDNSATHTEIKLTKEGPILIELGARLGGDFITSHLVPFATGVDMERNIILIALNEPVEVIKKIDRHAGIQFIHKYNYFDVKEMLGFKDYEKKVVHPFSLKDLKSSLDRLGYLICTDDSREGLLKKFN